MTTTQSYFIYRDYCGRLTIVMSRIFGKNPLLATFEDRNDAVDYVRNNK